MTQKSKRQLALTDLVNRLSFIQVAKGYNTDAGLHIFLGEVPRFGPNDPPAALAVVVGDDSPETTGGTTRTRVPFEVQAIVPADMTAPTLAIEEIIADIKEAVEIEADGSVDRYLGVIDGKPATLSKGLQRGAIRSIRREPGSEYVGAAVEYVATFEEKWGSQ